LIRATLDVVVKPPPFVKNQDTRALTFRRDGVIVSQIAGQLCSILLVRNSFGDKSGLKMNRETQSQKGKKNCFHMG
jgi:hypothetical protein